MLFDFVDRTLNKWYAISKGYAWSACPFPECGRMYGGHERGRHRIKVSDDPVLYSGTCAHHDHLANPFLRTRSSDRSS